LLDLSLVEASLVEPPLSGPCPAVFSRDRSLPESLELEVSPGFESPEPPVDFDESPSPPLPFEELESEEWLRFAGPPLRSFFAQPEPLK
jgi:hypothetical protein